MGIHIVAAAAALLTPPLKNLSHGFARFTGRARIEIAKSKHMVDLRKDFTIEIWVRFQKTINDQYFAGNYAWPAMSPKVKVAYNCGWVLRKRRERDFRGRPSKRGKDRLEFAFGTLQKGWSKLEYKYKPSGAAAHIAVCRRRDRLTMYVNGAGVAQTTLRGLTMVMSPTPIYVGPRPYMPSDRQFRGDVQAFRISTRSRYGTARFKPDTSLKADKSTLVLYDFSQQTDREKAIDLSINQRNGKLQNVVLHLATVSKTAKPKANTGDIRTGILPLGATLKKGQSLYSKNGKYRLLIDDSGNLTLRRTGVNRVLWHSPIRRTKGRGFDLHHQGDGNVIVRDAKKRPLWATGTNGHNGTYLELRHNGNLVVYGKGGRALWQSGSRQRNDAPSKQGREKATAAELKKLHGTWMILGAEADGRKLPKDPAAKDFVLTGNKFNGITPGMTFKIDPTKSPKQIDLTVERRGMTIVTKAIYKFAKDSLVFVIPMVEAGKGADHERPKDFKTKGKKVILIRTKRKK